jgi:hypothetical protein
MRAIKGSGRVSFCLKEGLQIGILNRKRALELASKQGDAPIVRILHAMGLENRYMLMPKYNGVQSKQQNAAWESGAAWVVAFGRSRSGGSAVVMM